MAERLAASASVGRGDAALFSGAVNSIRNFSKDSPSGVSSSSFHSAEADTRGGDGRVLIQSVGVMLGVSEYNNKADLGK